jgi:hypothetical protein
MRSRIVWATLARRLLLLGVLASLTGCGTFYVDGTLKDVDPSRYRKVEPLHPVQVLFEFQTKGVANARATDLLKARVIEQVTQSGLFSGVTGVPGPDSALLGITVNNVPTDDTAFRKGFVTGMTFGLVGSQVSDGYVGTARYTPPAAASTLTKEGRHAIHTTIGATGPPPNSVKMDSINAAVTLMLHQLIGNLLLEISADPAFK